MGTGGAEVLTLDVLSRLDREAFHVEVLCLREPGTLGAEVEERGVPLRVLGRSGRYDTSTLPRLVGYLRAADPDVFLTMTEHAPLFFARLAAPLARRPETVVAVHAFGEEGRLPGWMMRTMFLSDVLLLIAPSQRRALERVQGLGRSPWRSAPVAYIRNGISVGAPPGPTARAEGRARLGLSDSDLVIGTVAGFRRVKGHDVLLRAVAELAPTERRLRLVFLGFGEEEEALARQTRELGLSERVVWAGRRRDVREVLPAFDVKCLPSRREAFPLAVMEAMAAGLPIVASRTGGVPEMVSDGDEGLLVRPEDHVALAASLRRLLGDSALRARMGAAARRRAERDFDIRDTVVGYEALFRALASRRRRGAGPHPPAAG
jgi:glycosyltransferase involved in cell wall biosynthesis